MTWVDVVVEPLRVTGLAGFVLFAVLYQVTTRGAWRRRPEGWWLMALSASSAEFLGLAVAAQIWGPHYWGRPAFQTIVYAQLTLLPVVLIVLLFRAQSRDRRRPPT